MYNPYDDPQNEYHCKVCGEPQRDPHWSRGICSRCWDNRDTEPTEKPEDDFNEQDADAEADRYHDHLNEPRY